MQLNELQALGNGARLAGPGYAAVADGMLHEQQQAWRCAFIGLVHQDTPLSKQLLMAFEDDVQDRVQQRDGRAPQALPAACPRSASSRR